jgi:hypothetical protein
MTWRAAPALALLLLAGCEEPSPIAEREAPRAVRAAQAAPAAPAQPATAEQEARRLAEERLRARLRAEGELTQRAVQVHRQARADTLAVCGQVHPAARPDDTFIPYVAVVALEEGRPARAELHLAASTPEATRVYFEMVDRCFDGGGPAHARAAARPLPPAPSGLEVVREVTTAPVATQATGAAMPVAAAAGGGGPGMAALGTAGIRSAANLRASPSGGGEVLRVLPRGATVEVFGQAPGNWFQIGEGEPWGWVHGSLIEPR